MWHSPARALGGGAGAAVFWGFGESMDSNLLRALGFAGFMLNLINLIPVGILDGGAVWRSYRLAKSEPMVPLEAGGAAVLLPGAGRANATLILTLYIGLAVLLALGMWGTHVPQHRL